MPNFTGDMWYRLKAFLRFYREAKTKFNVHSPFLYDLLTGVLDINKEFYPFSTLEEARKDLLHDHRKIAVKDYGAGSQVMKDNVREVCRIASTSLSNPRKCRVLFNLVNHYKCTQVLELGTSLGLSSAYMASANRLASVVTLEGDENISAIARELHSKMKIINVEVVTGPFEETLSGVLHRMTKRPDLVFLDGNHKKEAVIEYYEAILPFCHDGTVIVVDDIYWSEDMESGWKSLVSRPEITLSVDLFEVGLLFFNKSLSRENHRIFPFKYKPWRIGLFG